MIGHTCGLLAITAILARLSFIARFVQARPESCQVAAKVKAGWLCGMKMIADDGAEYASFRGVPYAKQPLGELRFKELEPVEPWDDYLDAKDEGPICYQTDVMHGTLMSKSEMGEACIYANVHVPIHALPKSSRRKTRKMNPRRRTLDEDQDSKAGLPVLVFIHGGGFAFGSGHTDIHGPEFLVSSNVIVITFNYRLNVFGFLSLNSSKVPGNNGLRDMITLLRWVQKNVRAFGGDPDKVTLSGQSAGSISAHLLTLSKATEGLFKRTVLMSGTAISTFFSPSPLYAEFIKKLLLKVLGITATSSDEIYQELLDLPGEKLHEANNELINQLGITTFFPVVESSFPGVTPVIDDYPDKLIAQGRGKNIPLLVGYTDSECETFRERQVEFDFVGKAKKNPAAIVPPKTLFSAPLSLKTNLWKKMLMYSKYYNGTISVDGFVKSCTDGMYEYPVIKLVAARGSTPSSPMYVYRFAFDSQNSTFKTEKHTKFRGAGHMEDLLYLFKTNSVFGSKSVFPPKNDEDSMKVFMPSIVVNFMKLGKPFGNDTLWPPTNKAQFLHEYIQSPSEYQIHRFSPRQQEIVRFFDSLDTDKAQ